MTTRPILCLALAVAASVPLIAHAQDLTPIADRILSDPTYLPLKGQIFGDSTYDYQRIDGSVFDDTGAQTASTRNTLNTLRQSFAYGVTDALSLNVSIGYGFSGHSRVVTADGATTINQSGWEDPTLGATYRLLDQRNHPVSLDVIGSYSPDAFQNRTATATQDATIARGGPAADFGLALGRETRMFTIRGEVSARYLGSSDLENTVSGDHTVTSSHWAPSLGVQTQTRLTSRLSANVGAGYTFNGSPTVTDRASGLERTLHLGDTQDVNVSLNYHFIPNRLVGSVNYRHTFYGGSNEAFANPTLDFSRQRDGDNVGAELRYVFN
ncbi:MAG: hypothetical protein ABI306_05820 [Caulobacteraceae bacterium]